MSSDKRKYAYIAIASLVAVATVYVICLLFVEGNPNAKSQNEYLIKANKLHNDSLYEEAVEPYMKAAGFNEQQSLVNYNLATNSLMKNYEQLSKVFNEEGYQLDAAVDSALIEATGRLEDAGDAEEGAVKYSDIYHNIGVTSHMRNNLEEAAEAYKEALRKNPADEDARYNLALILYQQKKEQQQQNQQNQQQQQDKKDKKNKDKQQQQQNNNKEEEKKKDKQEQQQQQQQQQQDKKEQDKKEQEQQQQQEKEQQEEKEKIEQMLKALIQDEKDIREKLEKSGEKIKVNYPEKNW